MLSPPDMLVIGAMALIFFGPDQLPKVARKAGQVMRDVQNTSQSFIREMEKAADEMDIRQNLSAYAEQPKMPDAPVMAERAPTPIIVSEPAVHVEPVRAPAPVTERENDPAPGGVAHENSSGI